MKLTDKEIIEALKTGKKIRLSWWERGYYLKAFDLTWELVIYYAGRKAENEMGLTIDDIEAEDWEIVK